jgi:hypothetical protein
LTKPIRSVLFYLGHPNIYTDSYFTHLLNQSVHITSCGCWGGSKRYRYRDCYRCCRTGNAHRQGKIGFVSRNISSISRRIFVEFIVFPLFFFRMLKVPNIGVNFRSFLNVIEKKFDLKVIIKRIDAVLFNDFSADRR